MAAELKRSAGIGGVAATVDAMVVAVSVLAVQIVPLYPEFVLASRP
jgi:hypothetical protein